MLSLTFEVDWVYNLVIDFDRYIGAAYRDLSFVISY